MVGKDCPRNGFVQGHACLRKQANFASFAKTRSPSGHLAESLALALAVYGYFKGKSRAIVNTTNQK
jgi:hypothetical protein